KSIGVRLPAGKTAHRLAFRIDQHDGNFEIVADLCEAHQLRQLFGSWRRCEEFVWIEDRIVKPGARSANDERHEGVEHRLLRGYRIDVAEHAGARLRCARGNQVSYLETAHRIDAAAVSCWTHGASRLGEDVVGI